MRALGAEAGFVGGRAEGGLEVEEPAANLEGPGGLSEGTEGDELPRVRLTEVLYEGDGRPPTIGSTANSRSESEEEIS